MTADCHPVDNRQGIIKKMRIDLSCQGLKFKLLQRNLIFINLMDQTVDFIHHASKAPDQKSNLIICITIYRNLPASLVYAVHIVCKFLDLSGKNPGKSKSQHQNDYQANCNQRNLAHQNSGNRAVNCWLQLIQVKIPSARCIPAFYKGIILLSRLQIFTGNQRLRLICFGIFIYEQFLWKRTFPSSSRIIPPEPSEIMFSKVWKILL